MNLANIDLNLLVHLDALLQEVHVTNAGKRVGLSQSAMSRALSKLRDLFEDELLVKTAHGMVLSPKAEALAPQVRSVLRHVERTLQPDLPFQPEQEAHTFSIAMSPLVTPWLTVPLLARLRAISAGLRCAIRPLQEAFPSGALRRGELDLVFSTTTRMPSEHRAQELAREELCTVIPEHLEPPRSAREWAELPHVRFTLHGDDFDLSELVLSQLGLARHVALDLHTLDDLPPLVHDLGYCVTLPRNILSSHFDEARLHAPPLQLPPVLTTMNWSAHAEHDPANQWLRQLVLDLARTR